jgi:hypothetical protein
MPNITSADSVYTLVVPEVFDGPFQLEGYSADAAFETGQSDNGEVILGVDGILSAGWVPYLTEQTIQLQADSNSIDIFDQWIATENQAREKFQATAIIILPSIGRKYSLAQGYLKSIVPIPSARKVLQPRSFVIVWGLINVGPT